MRRNQRIFPSKDNRMPVTITATPRVNIAGRTPNYFGVGELIDLSATIVAAPPGAATPVWRWEVKPPMIHQGRGHFSTNNNQALLIPFQLVDQTIEVRAWNAGNS